MGDDFLKIAMADPEDFYTIDALKVTYGLNVQVCQGKESDILDTVERLYGAGSQSLETIIEEAGKDVYDISAENVEDEDHLRDLASEAPIIRLVNRLIFNAVEQKASDIHFEPFENEFKARYRIDGVLHDVESPPHRLAGGHHQQGQNYGQAGYCGKKTAPGRPHQTADFGQGN
jgi:general secretion pathway protein E